MGSGQYDLEAESARVQGELIAFRDSCLPGLLVGAGRQVGVSYLEWRRATEGLIVALPMRSYVGRFHPEWFEFLPEVAQPGYEIQSGSIVWRCKVGLYAMKQSAAEYLLKRFGGGEGPFADPERQLAAHLPEVRNWLLGLPVGDTGFYNSLSLVPPLLVDADLEFVLRVLDTENWRGIVLDSPGLTPADRVRRLGVIDGVLFQTVLNNALLDVLGAMANNRFADIPALMRHPNLIGSYTHLMPYYLLSVLLAKVLTLRRLATSEPQVTASQEPPPFRLFSGAEADTQGLRGGAD